MNKSDIAKIVIGLRDGGIISFQKIADRLNADGIPTVSGRGLWESKMVQRICAANALKTVEKRVGVVTDNKLEIERLNDEINLLARDMSNVRQSESEKQVEIERLNTELDRLQSELDIVRQDNKELKINAVSFEKLNHLNNTINIYKNESERLNRQLTETEIKFKTQYESEITRLGSELAVANQTIQELKDKQGFIKLEQKNQKNFEGWTINLRYDGKGVNLVKRINGKFVAVYIGKTFDPDVARQKIGIKMSKIASTVNNNNDSKILLMF